MSLEPLDRLDGLARSAREALRQTTLPLVDPDLMLTDLSRVRSRRRWAMSATAAVTVLAVATAGWLGSRADDTSTSRPTPVTSTTPSPGLALLPPLCGSPSWQRYMNPPWDHPNACPASTPAGTYYSALLGLNDYSIVTIHLPSGWRVGALPGPTGVGQADPGPGIEISEATGRSGVTLVYDPTPAAFNDHGLRSPAQVLDWVASRRFLQTSTRRTVSYGGWRALQMDVRARPGATTTDTCRTTPPCIPVLKGLLDNDVTAIELHPGTSGRLIIFASKEGSAPSAAIWIWADDGGSAAAATQLARSLEIAPVEFSSLP